MRKKRELVERLLTASAGSARLRLNPKDVAEAYTLLDFLTRNRDTLGYEKDVYFNVTTEETPIDE